MTTLIGRALGLNASVTMVNTHIDVPAVATAARLHRRRQGRHPLAGPTTGKTVVWTMNGATKTASAYTSSSAGTVWAVAGVADFNGDGKADILWRNTTTGKTVGSGR